MNKRVLNRKIQLLEQENQELRRVPKIKTTMVEIAEYIVKEANYDFTNAEEITVNSPSEELAIYVLMESGRLDELVVKDVIEEQ